MGAGGPEPAPPGLDLRPWSRRERTRHPPSLSARKQHPGTQRGVLDWFGASTTLRGILGHAGTRTTSDMNTDAEPWPRNTQCGASHHIPGPGPCHHGTARTPVPGQVRCWLRAPAGPAPCWASSLRRGGPVFPRPRRATAHEVPHLSPSLKPRQLRSLAVGCGGCQACPWRSQVSSTPSRPRALNRVAPGVWPPPSPLAAGGSWASSLDLTASWRTLHLVGDQTGTAGPAWVLGGLLRLLPGPWGEGGLQAPVGLAGEPLTLGGVCLFPHAGLSLPGLPWVRPAVSLTRATRYGVPRGPDRRARQGPSGPGQRPGGGHHLLLTPSRPRSTWAGWGSCHTWFPTEVSRIAPQLCSPGQESARRRKDLMWRGGADALSSCVPPRSSR